MHRSTMSNDGGEHYAKAEGVARIGSTEVPHCVEAWVRCARLAHGDYTDEKIELLINGEPSGVPMSIGVNSKGLWLSGGGLFDRPGGGKRAKRARYTVRLNLIVPPGSIGRAFRCGLPSEGVLYFGSFRNAMYRVLRKACGDAYQAMPQANLPEVARRPYLPESEENDIAEYAFRFGIVGADLDALMAQESEENDIAEIAARFGLVGDDLDRLLALIFEAEDEAA